MSARPLVFATVVSGIAATGDTKTVGRIGLKAVGWFVTASLVSLTLGMMLSPGVFLFTEQVQVTGGSGLYANATGTEFAVGVINLATSQFAGVGRGVITY